MKPTRAGRDTPPGPVTSVVLAREPSCCQGPAGSLARRLERQISKTPGLQREDLAPSDSPPRPTVPEQGQVEHSLDQARKLYVAMKMIEARQGLQEILKQLRKHVHQGLPIRLLARTHLLLGTTFQAEGQMAQARQHYASAITFVPDIALDSTAFSPEVRGELEQARQKMETTVATVRSVPAGARVIWDGTARGSTPFKLKDQPLGEHFLRLEHPLYKPWEDRIRVSARSQLEVQLEPLAPGELLDRARRDPELRQQAQKLLGVDRLMILQQKEQGLGLQVFSSSGSRALQLKSHQDRRELARVVDRLVASPPLPAASRPAPATSPVRRPEPARPDFFRRTWWIWAIAGSAAVAAGVAIPLTMSSGDESDRGPVRLKIPR